MPRRWVCSLRVCPRVSRYPWRPLRRTLTVVAQGVWVRPLAMRPICRELRASIRRVALLVRCCVLASVIVIYEVVTMTICAVNPALRMPTWCSCVSMARSVILRVVAWPRAA